MTVVLGHPIDIYGALYIDIQRSDDIYCLTKIGVDAYIEIYREHSCTGEPQMTGRFALQEEVEAFSDKVIALVCPKYGNHWRERVQRLWDDVQQRGFVERTDATKKLYMSRFRKGVRDRLATEELDEDRRKRVDVDLMKIIQIDRTILSQLHEDYKARVKAANSNLTLVPEWKQVVTILREMLKSDDMEIRVLGLCGLTGRRFREIVQSADLRLMTEVTPIGSVRQRWLVFFKGQLKTRGGEGTMANRDFAIPVLAPASEIVAGFRDLRDSAQGRIWLSADEGAIKSTLNNALNTKLKGSAIERFWPKDAPLSLKELRALYAEIAYENFGPRTTRAPYYARILGHGIEDETTALSYMRYSLNTKGQREGMEEINRLTMLRETRREEFLAERAKAGGDDNSLIEEDD